MSRRLTMSAMVTLGLVRNFARSLVGTASMKSTSPDSRAAVRAASLLITR